MLQGLLDKYDANQDGVLDQTELAALRKDVAEGKVTPPRGGPGGPGQPGGFRGPEKSGAPQRRLPKDLLDKYDLNKDGKLDESERAALHKDIEDGKISPPNHGRGPGGPGGPPPPLSAAQILEKFDADKDGKLDESELAAFVKDMEAHRPPPPPGFAGPGGPPPGEGPDGP
jgi:Ca2+-binding EF-hand superfamily protein